MTTERTLEQWREAIEKEVDYVDIKPFSHNIIGIALSAIAKKFGEAEAKKAITDYGLDEMGWNA